jgi:hypothetical protein
MFPFSGPFVAMNEPSVDEFGVMVIGDPALMERPVFCHA